MLWPCSLIENTCSAPPLRADKLPANYPPFVHFASVRSWLCADESRPSDGTCVD